MQRTIQAPEWEWGTREQCAAYLGIDLDQFKLLCRTGRFPFEPASYGRKTHRWHWLDVVCFSHMQARRSSLIQPLEPENRGEEK